VEPDLTGSGPGGLAPLNGRHYIDRR